MPFIHTYSTLLQSFKPTRQTMLNKANGIIERDNIFGDKYGEESWKSSGSEDLCEYFICPSLCSYSSLEVLSCTDVDEEECRLVKLNNTIKKLVDLIDDPVKRQDYKIVCCYLHKMLKYNGSNGYYARFLPQIGEILEFVAARSKLVDEYQYLLHSLLYLCGEPLLLLRASERLSCRPAIRRHFGLLGCLLVLAPTRDGFLLAKTAIERLLEGPSCRRARGAAAAGNYRRDALGSEARREAVEASRLPLTLVELAEVASEETYLDVLEILLKLVEASSVSCFRVLEAGIEDILLLRMHPEYGCQFKCGPVDNDTNLQLDKEDYHKPLEYSTKILWKLMTSMIMCKDLPESITNLSPPKPAAMCGFSRQMDNLKHGITEIYYNTKPNVSIISSAGSPLILWLLIMYLE